EGSPASNWRWCESQGELSLINSSGHAKTVELEMCFGTMEKQVSQLWLEGPLFSVRLEGNEQGTRFVRTITVPPGRHRVRLTCGATKVRAPNDPRTLVFRVTRFLVREEDGP